MHDSQKSQFPGNARYDLELASASLNATRQRRENIPIWFAKMWLRKIYLAIRSKKLYKLKLSRFQSSTIKLYFTGKV
jgi:hypothetical protein